MEVVESSDESDSDSDEKGDVTAMFLHIFCMNPVCHSWLFCVCVFVHFFVCLAEKIACCQCCS